MVIDSHVHILNADDKHLADLLRAADRSGIDKLCISSLSRRWVEFPSEAQLEEAAQDVLAALERYPDRFYGFAYVSAQHPAKSRELIERCIATGPCRLVKLWVSQHIDDPRLDPLLARAEALGAPVMAHTFTKATGNLSQESTCHHAAARARRQPGLRIWLAHYSGRWEETARVIRDVPNLALDLSGGEPEDGVLECLLKHIGPDRVFFGSDAPGRSFAVQKTKVTSAAIPDHWKRMILGENVGRWLGA